MLGSSIQCYFHMALQKFYGAFVPPAFQAATPPNLLVMSTDFLGASLNADIGVHTHYYQWVKMEVHPGRYVQEPGVGQVKAELEGLGLYGVGGVKAEYEGLGLYGAGDVKAELEDRGLYGAGGVLVLPLPYSAPPLLFLKR